LNTVPSINDANSKFEWYFTEKMKDVFRLLETSDNTCAKLKVDTLYFRRSVYARPGVGFT